MPDPENKVLINGVLLSEKELNKVYFVHTLSDELKQIIRKQLSGIFNGFADVEELPGFYSYKRTLESFLDRYNEKAEDTQKGMIAELLAHVLINEFVNEFSSLSVLKNKEERSIKKGFDIIYYDKNNTKLWYAEVKSGHRGEKQATEFNIDLLKRSKNGIQEMFDSRRNSLWESALIDVKLTVEEGPRRIDMRQLLSKDSLVNAPTINKRNVVLISVLYNEFDDKIDIKDIIDYHHEVNTEAVFAESIMISIQKRTYQNVALFLQTEST